MRIASLVPHATELLFALGCDEEVVAVTHECDWPPQAQELPQLTRDALPSSLGAGEIDRAVRARTIEGLAIYELDEQALADAEPDLIVTQALCPVCAVSYEEVEEIAGRLPGPPQVISLDPKTFGETLGDIRTIAGATGRKDEGVALVRSIADRIDRVKLAVRGLPAPRVLALEWLDPVFVAGHWTPQLIELAGGQDALGLPGEPSEQLSWEALAAARPEVIVAMPCGFDEQRAREEVLLHAEQLSALGARRLVAVNGSAYFSRPGPRLIDGLELLAHILHPEAVPQAAGQAIELDLAAPTP
jgi:iron complex transport system substrate-binding protein